MKPATMLHKVWDQHVVARIDDEVDLLHVDRHVVQESACAPAFEGLRRRGLRVRNPELTFGVIDHVVSTAPGRTGDTYPEGQEFIRLIRQDTAREGVTLFDVDDPRQGIVHVITPELGIALPGTTLLCPDSHTPTCGGLGALAWGTGTSDTEHVFATQMLLQRRPRAMRIWFEGRLQPGVYPKDLILHLIGQVGVSFGSGYAVEYAGPVISAMPVEGRMTICNMSIEFGARYGFIAPDDTTFEYIAGRLYAPSGGDWDEAVRHWRSLPSDDGCAFDSERRVDCSRIGPQVTWGVTPDQVLSIGEPVPDPAGGRDAPAREAIAHALAYQGLSPGQSLEGLPIGVAFIGSCTNSRLSDLEIAAAVVRGRRVAPGVRALVVPGSTQVKAAAEAAGLDRVFQDAGFEWRESGCSMCLSINDDVVPPGVRCMSTSNRNFEHRQGRDARTHLASPAMVAAAALAGAITDVRKFVF